MGRKFLMVLPNSFFFTAITFYSLDIWGIEEAEEHVIPCMFQEFAKNSPCHLS